MRISSFNFGGSVPSVDGTTTSENLWSWSCWIQMNYRDSCTSVYQGINAVLVNITFNKYHIPQRRACRVSNWLVFSLIILIRRLLGWLGRSHERWNPTLLAFSWLSVFRWFPFHRHSRWYCPILPHFEVITSPGWYIMGFCACCNPWPCQSAMFADVVFQCWFSTARRLSSRSCGKCFVETGWICLASSKA